MHQSAPLLWGCADTNGKGLEVANLLLQSNLCLLNTKFTTYIHPATGSRSSIDLAICDPALFLDLSWNVHDDFLWERSSPYDFIYI